MEDVLQEIKQERARQDAKWGGPEHDDQHGQGDWVGTLYRLVCEANPPGPVDLAQFRKQMVQVAAVGVAAVESLDRLYPEVRAGAAAESFDRKYPAAKALADNAKLAAMLQPPPEIRDAAKPDDLREAGWMVAAHYDLYEYGKRGTAWCLVLPEAGRYLAGQGETDAEALGKIRDKLQAQTPQKNQEAEAQA